MERNKIICSGMTFTESKIKSGRIFLSNSIAFDELGIDTLDAELDLSEEVGTVFAPKDYDGLTTEDNRLFTVKPYFRVLVTDPSQFTYGKRVDYYRNEKIFGSFYMYSIRRVSQFFYAISCISAVGLLDTVQHYGGIYNNATFASVVQNIIKNAVPYTVAANVQNIRVFGWLPVATARDNLRQLLFSSGVALKKNTNGNISFELLNTSVPYRLPDNKIMLGGSVEFPAAASEVVVIEHSFFQSSVDETVTLYDGSVVASSFVSPAGVSRNGILVRFDDPVYNLSASGVSILESGVNYAVLSGGGHAVLTGKKYAHTMREVQRTISTAQSAMVGGKNVARVENATLVSVMNSNAVAGRVASYYSSSRTVSSKILAETERPGDAVTFSNPFRETDTGLIASMDINISRNLLADTKIVAGYTPVSGGTFNNRQFLTGAGTFTVPAGITKLHAVLIGGGQGGQSGGKGGPGVTSSKKTDQHPEKNTIDAYLAVGTGGAGGQAGGGGSGGNIYQTTIDVTPGAKINYSCGAGGAGGVSNKDRSSGDDWLGAGSAGGATVFGAYSSAAGSPSGYGYSDIFTGNIYGAKGYDGIAGGRGGGVAADSDDWIKQAQGPAVIYNGVTYYSGANNTEVVSAESSAKFGENAPGRPYGLVITAGAQYGAGGGAAAGRNGDKATDTPTASARASQNTFNRRASARGGAGGQGADAAAPAGETRYGAGGRGGNGGGGEGAPGAAAVTTFANGYVPGTTFPMPSELSLTQAAGTGRGLGSNGGAGGPGCILIYY